MIAGDDRVPRAVRALRQRWHLEEDAAMAALTDLVEETGASLESLAELIAGGSFPDSLVELDGPLAHADPVLGQATGLLMAQRGIGADEAVEVLTRLAEERDRRVRDMAGDLVRWHAVAAAAAPRQEQLRPGLSQPARRPVGRLDAGVCYERYYAAPSAQVMASLVRTLAEHGRLERIEGHGFEVVFVTSRDPWVRTVLLRGWVNEWQAGTLLQVEAVEQEVLTEAQDAEEMARLMHVLGLVGEGTSRPSGPDVSSPVGRVPRAGPRG